MNSLLDNFQQMNGETSNTTIRGHKTASIIENKNKKKRKKGRNTDCSPPQGTQRDPLISRQRDPLISTMISHLLESLII